MRASTPLFLGLLAVGLAGPGPAKPGAPGHVALDNGVARTPPMGWNSWNHFGCNVSEQLVKETADAMVASGMRDAGYRYVVIDDCWQVARDAAGSVVADSGRFPHGIKALADYVHAKGLDSGSIPTRAPTRARAGRGPWTMKTKMRGRSRPGAWIM
jgi:alpha-galactosidase